MKKEYKFIVGGILGLAASAGVSFITGNIWTGFFTAILIGVVYLIVLDLKVVKSLQNPIHRTTIRILIVSMVFVQCFATYVGYDNSQFAKNNLAKTRSSLDEGISKWKTQKILLDVLKHYYNDTNPSESTIASSFREVMGERLGPDNSIDLSESNIPEEIIYRYEILSSDEVLIRARATIGLGKNPEFVNVNSETGKYQATATLTPGGISYEREN